MHECNLFDDPLKDYSKTYGRPSLLFSMFNGGLAHDVMHDILEGVA